MSSLLSISPTQIRDANSRGILWEVRLEFVGRNADNLSGRSSKFWSLESSSKMRDADVIVRWGKIGTAGQAQRKSYAEGLNKLQEKLKEGYRPTTSPVSLTPAPSKPVAPPTPPLPEPYCRIVTVVLHKAGETFQALDRDGILVMNLSRTGVTKLFEMAPHLKAASPDIHL